VIRRRDALFVLAGLLAAGGAHARAATRPVAKPLDALSKGSRRLVLYADRDDDDDDGVADADESPEGASARDVRWFSTRRAARLQAPPGGVVRVIRDGKILSGSARVTRFGLQGVHAGRAELRVGKLALRVSVIEAMAFDEDGRRVDLATSHASLSRVLPAGLWPDPTVAHDADALRWTVIAPHGALPALVSFASTREDGKPLDRLDGVPLVPCPCPRGVATGLECARTEPIRLSTDRIDRDHPASRGCSLLGEVGGRVVAETRGQKIASIRVGGPRHTVLGSIDRYQARLRVHVVRIARGGAPAIGGDTRGALALGRSQVRAASDLWGQCGIDLVSRATVDVVDPPPAYLLAVGCDLGLPASGGRLTFRVGSRRFQVATRAGDSPTAVAERVAAALRRGGLSAVVSPNAPIRSGALPSADVLVKTAGGRLATLSAAPGTPLSSDASLAACIGEVNLADGLSHFSDFDSAAGTVEERSLVKAYEDGDPQTVDVFIVPSFAESGRIGESFVAAEGASIQNVVIVDRTAVAAGTRSNALGHELGHVLLDMPGHPDDYGVDTPWLLMDSDADDATIFGPRRLTLAECVRAVRESGPDAPLPLFERAPLFHARGAVARRGGRSRAAPTPLTSARFR
jgi:hypothetical protein